MEQCHGNDEAPDPETLEDGTARSEDDTGSRTQ